jgi:2-oxoacid:acceptor oxidoreductase gamma subunit (pyruvate/2-ketoisovalerate family)
MILADAAYREGYKGVTAAPFFGAERRGAPVIATNRFAWKPIRTFSLVQNPDVVVVLDETLLDVVDVTAGIHSDGLVIINSTKRPEEVQLNVPINVATTDATHWAKEADLTVSGTVISNTAILGGVVKAIGFISLESIEKALLNHFKSEEAAKKNVRGAQLAYEGTLLLKECRLYCA